MDVPHSCSTNAVDVTGQNKVFMSEAVIPQGAKCQIPTPNIKYNLINLSK